MQAQADVQQTFDSRCVDGGVNQRGAAPGRSVTPAPAFPGLGEIIRLVDDALALRRTEAVTAHIRRYLPALIEALRAELPMQLLQVNAQGYRRFELHHCPIGGYQILAMVWGPGQGTPIHDHNDLWGVEAVIHGELQVSRYRIREVAGTALRLEPTDLVELRSGDIETFDAEHGVHLCRNPSQRAAAVSLHVYGRPLDRFGIYVDEGDGWHGRREHAPRIESLSG